MRKSYYLTSCHLLSNTVTVVNPNLNIKTFENISHGTVMYLN